MLPQIDRYLVSRFARVLALAMLSFVVIYIVVDLIDHLDDFMRHGVSPTMVAAYYVHYVPYIIVLTTPVGMLLATLFVIGAMGSDNELMAMKAAGISTWRIAVPLLRTGALVSVLVLLMAELVVPSSNEARRNIHDFSRGQTISGSVRHICRQDPSGFTFYAAYYDESRKIAQNVTLVQLAHNEPVRRIDALQMVWDEEGWRLTQPVDRRFVGSGSRLEANATMRLPELQLRPEDLARVDKLPEQMSYLDLADYIQRTERAGGNAARWHVDLHLKGAFPLANLMLVWIGFPIAARVWRGGKAMYIGITLGVAFIFFVCVRGGQALGRSGALPPEIAAWGPDVLFFAVGLLLFHWTRK